MNSAMIWRNTFFLFILLSLTEDKYNLKLSFIKDKYNAILSVLKDKNWVIYCFGKNRPKIVRV
jgi:hypothetical protein